MSVDYRLLAQAYGLDIPSADLERIGASLSALQDDFRPLDSLLDFATEPAIILSEDAVSASIE